MVGPDIPALPHNRAHRRMVTHPGLVRSAHRAPHERTFAMDFRGTRLRFGLLVAFLCAFLTPVVASAGTAIACDDFANPDAAQHLLDLDDSYADALDPDGDGTACNEDDDAVEPLSDEDYIYAVWDEVDLQVDSVLEFVDVIEPMGDEGLSQSEVQQIFEDADAIAQTWTDYPQRAPEFDAPRGYEEVDALYHTWIGTLGDLSLAWQAVVDDKERGQVEDQTIEDFETAIHAFGTTSDDLIGMLAAAEEDLLGSTPAGAMTAITPGRP
jgi:hypothetical protein